MSTFKKWLLTIIVVIALLHMGFGSISDILRTGQLTSQHGWTEALILMLLAIVVAIAVK
jgi:hypothetical protein